MKLPLLSILLTLIMSATTSAQKTVSDLKPAHAIALEKFLSSHKNYQFLSETVIDAETLKFMRQTFGKTFHPYYKTGDFNHDRILDFALILSRKIPPKPIEGTDEFDHSLAVAIFNGNRKGGYANAFLEDVENSLNCLLGSTEEKRDRLTFGVYESDAGFIMPPVGKGYILEYGAEP